MVAFPVPAVVYDACRAHIEHLYDEEKKLLHKRDVVLDSCIRSINMWVDRGELPKEKRDEEIERARIYIDRDIYLQKRELDVKIQQLEHFIWHTGG